MPMSEDERLNLYERLMAEKKGNNLGALGGVATGLSRIAQADSTSRGGEFIDAGEPIRQAEKSAQDRAESERSKWMDRLNLDRADRKEEYQKDRDIKSDEFKQKGIDLRERIATQDQDSRQQEFDQQQQRLDAQQKQIDVKNQFLRGKLGKSFVEGAPTDLNEDLLGQQQAEEKQLADKTEQATKLAENMTLTDSGKPMTASQADTQSMLDRASAAETALRQAKLPEPTTLENMKDMERIKNIPGLAYLAEGLEVFTGEIGKPSDPEEQKYLNAAMVWLMSTLRDESGAAIGKDEAVRQYSTYFPTEGDTPATIDQKNNLREVVVGGLRKATGNTRQKFSWEESSQ